MKKRLLFILCLFSLASGAVIAQTKTVTNRDLEKYRQKRLQAEREYRENYAKLGFPSPEELEKRNAESRRQLSELSRQIEAENSGDQASFQERASLLRAEIASVQAQINYLRGELNRLPRQNLFASSGYFLPDAYDYYAPNAGYNSGYKTRRRTPYSSFTVPSRTKARTNRTSTMSATPNPRRNYIGGNGRSSFGIGISIGNTGNYGGYGYRNRRSYGGNYGYPNYNGGYVAPYFSGSQNSYERDELVTQVRALEQTKAGLLAEFDVLEDEARRAGVKID